MTGRPPTPAELKEINDWQMGCDGTTAVSFNDPHYVCANHHHHTDWTITALIALAIVLAITLWNRKYANENGRR